MPVLVVGSRDEADPCTRSGWPRSTRAGCPRARAGGRGRRASRRSPGRARGCRARSPTSSSARLRPSVEHAAEAHDRRALLDGDLVVLASCPSRAARGRARRPARPGGRSGGGCPRAARRTGGIVIRPVTGTGSARCSAASSPGSMPSFASSPATFTSIRTSRAGSARAGAARTRRPPSGSAARSGAMSLTLRLWSAPMKSQVNSSPLALVLGEQVLRAVLPDQLDAGLGERAAARRPARTSIAAQISTSAGRAPRPRSARGRARGCADRHRAESVNSRVTRATPAPPDGR